jgi:hypothetical protein
MLFIENRSGRRNGFSSFGADLWDPQFHRRPLAQVKSGPDVFADALVPRNVIVPWNALVPQAGAADAGTPIFPIL